MEGHIVALHLIEIGDLITVLCLSDREIIFDVVGLGFDAIKERETHRIIFQKIDVVSIALISIIGDGQIVVRLFHREIEIMVLMCLYDQSDRPIGDLRHERAVEKIRHIGKFQCI